MHTTRQETSSVQSFIKEWGYFFLLMVGLIASRFYLWNPVTVDGHSMDPTLADGERLIVLFHTNIERFDMVVAKGEDEKGKENQIVKRVIGMPGDTLSYNNDVLTINGQVVEEPYLADYLAKFKEDKLQSTYSYDKVFQERAQLSPSFTTDASFNPNFTVTVPEGEYFLIGDDRIVSKDSRSVGTFKKADLVGEVKLRYWPFNRIGLLD